jgi:hemoglobin
MQRQFLTYATGGPKDYKGKSMHDAHKGRGIKNEEFDKVTMHILNTLKDLNVN